MSESKSMHALFVDELRDAYDTEKQVIKALRKMARAAQHPDLSAAFTLHLEETTGQVAILEKSFGCANASRVASTVPASPESSRKAARPSGVAGVGGASSAPTRVRPSVA